MHATTPALAACTDLSEDFDSERAYALFRRAMAAVGGHDCPSPQAATSALAAAIVAIARASGQAAWAVDHLLAAADQLADEACAQDTQLKAELDALRHAAAI